jgi:mannose-6-phosphate isomerase-like protein (cupin superfamily)
MYILMAIAAYLAIGYLFHLVIFPEKKPGVSSYFKPGDVFYSSAEKIRQTVEKQENGFVYCTTSIEPFAGGPPKHIHTDFDETFEVENGELSVWVNGEVKTIRPGEKLFIPRGTPHKPFNETGDTIQAKGMVIFPEKFAYHLSQVYRYMDNTPGFEKSPKTLFQMSLFNSSGFDSYIADGPPVRVQKCMSFLLTPVTRLLGFRSYYEPYHFNSKS